MYIISLILLYLLGFKINARECLQTGGNFITTSKNSYGETELRISYAGTFLEETSAGITAQVLKIRQISDGRLFAQLIFRNGKMQDCQVSKSPKKIIKFVEQFEKPLKLLELQYFNKYNASDAFRQFNKNNSELKYKKIKKMTDLRLARKKCKMFRRVVRRELMSKKSTGNGYNEISHRNKRSFFLYPGTKWCGGGNAAANCEDLGDEIDADTCCRSHDHCPTHIIGMSWGYNLFNFRLHTISYCECDYKFRECLKNSTTPTCDLVGRIFFSYLGMKCFTLQPESVCVKRSWWGGCRQYSSQHKAKVQSPSTF